MSKKNLIIIIVIGVISICATPFAPNTDIAQGFVATGFILILGGALNLIGILRKKK